jgi:hypothetical protein
VITQAIAGLGGVGKTSLAVEYAYRQRGAFDVVWWLRAEEPATLISDFIALAGALDRVKRPRPIRRWWCRRCIAGWPTTAAG